MAKVYALPNEKEWEQKPKEDVDVWFKRQEALMQELEKKDEARKPGQYVGALIRHGVADGCATYVVHSMKPLQLLFVPYMDAYSAGAIWERGLTAADVKHLAGREERLGKIFGRK